MQFFKTYSSNTLAGTGNQCHFSAPNGGVGRVFYKIRRGGQSNYSFLWSNILDSTFASGAEFHKNMICDSWVVESLRVGVCTGVNPDDNVELMPVTFGGKLEKEVAPGEFFASDPVSLSPDAGDYICLEIAFRGNAIPFHQEIQIRVECRQSVQATLKVRIPAYAEEAQMAVGGEKLQSVPKGGMVDVKRTFHNGDVIRIVLTLAPRMETGWRGSASVYVGAQLMALALPDTNVSWRYAVIRSLPMTQVEDEGVPYVLITSCEAPAWREKSGFITPPPQDVPMGPAYELTLIPAAGADGRIAAFPCVRER